MVSRLTLAVQYATVLWHVRKYRRTWLPLGLMVAANVVAALIYLGVAFSSNAQSSHSYLAWYILGGLEVVLTAGVALLWDVLSFDGTHLIGRMSLLTFIIIGEGIAVVCTYITLIVKQPEAWSKSLSPYYQGCNRSPADIYILLPV